MAASAPTLSVIVPATDRPPTLGRCVEAVRAAAAPEDELIVVSEPPGGPAAARNTGAARARGDVLVFVDSDVVVAADALELIRRRLGPTGPDAVFGAYDADPAAPGAVSRFRNLLHHHVHSTAPGEAQTFWAGLGAVRRDVFERVGGFDAARYPLASIEDVELGLRLRRAGARIELRPEIQGRHLKRWTIGSFLRTDLLRRGVPWVALIRERGASGAGSGTLNLSRRNSAGALAALAALAGILARRPALVLAAVAAQVAVHRRFYALLGRRGGARLALAGIALHWLHHLAAIAAVPLGIAIAGRRER